MTFARYRAIVRAMGNRTGIPETIPVAHQPNYRTGYVGTWNGGQFLGNTVRQAGGRRTAPWLVYLHEFDAQGAYLRSRTASTGTGEDGRRGAAGLLREWLSTLPGLAYGNIAIKPFRTESEGTVFGLIVDDAHETERAELHPDQLGFRAPWDGRYEA